MSVLRAIAIFLCGLSLQVCSAQMVFPGSCPDVAVMGDFNANRYLGKWYEVEKYFAVFEFGGKCITANYDQKDNGVISVVNKQISSFTGMKSEIEGEAMQVSRSDEGKLSVRFPSLPINMAAPYWVVDTDYDNFALVWSCYEFGVFHTRNAWILTRERDPPVETLEKAYAAADKNNINRAYFLRTDQKNCTDDD
ncbi:apolipoprotein D-like [Vanessa tameamea]|uniref:Apolipoprotein D n=1 Tax=Vanessa tameamea TaxID=334116 RepID=A0A8B8IJ32_VANTA|nr:apolipoprotein D-like [Vanessa tameamea]